MLKYNYAWPVQCQLNAEINIYKLYLFYFNLFLV